MDAIWPLVVGFLLTTVLGGLLGTYLQRRSWEHQNEAQLRKAELDKAGQVCQAVSGLLDKRRYRMLRLFHAVRGPRPGPEAAWRPQCRQNSLPSGSWRTTQCWPASS